MVHSRDPLNSPCFRKCAPATVQFPASTTGPGGAGAGRREASPRRRRDASATGGPLLPRRRFPAAACRRGRSSPMDQTDRGRHTIWLPVRPTHPHPEDEFTAGAEQTVDSRASACGLSPVSHDAGKLQHRVVIATPVRSFLKALSKATESRSHGGEGACSAYATTAKLIQGWRSPQGRRAARTRRWITLRDRCSSARPGKHDGELALARAGSGKTLRLL